ncbi:MAG: hypothetical protein K2J69_02415 [Malacoplasma sp.]|nr:hypothetical protein [Malacoplasma sp.]
MSKLKWLKGLALSSFVGMTAISLVSCGSSNATHSFTSDPTNYLTDNNSPLNGNFNNSPILTYAQTQLYFLTTYQTTGKFEIDGENGGFKQTTNDTLILEGASAVIVFANDDVQKDIDNQLDPNLLTKNGLSQSQILQKLSSIKTSVNKSSTNSNSFPQQTQADESDASTLKWNEGTDYWVFTRDKGGIKFQNGIDQDSSDDISQYYNNAVSNGKTYQFIIDTDNKWIDGFGKEQLPISSKDFERGLEAYTLSVALGYPRNTYFLNLIGLSEQSLGKTIGYAENGKYVSSSDLNYDIDNFANQNDAVYTFYIDKPYLYTFDLISKEYFSPLPNTHQKVKNISLKNGKIAVDKNGKIDQTNTKFNELFGSGTKGVFTEETWYIGAYYVSAFTSNQIIFNLNHTYMETVGKHLLSYVDGKVVGDYNQNTDDRIEEIVINFGSGTADTYFENFKAGQIDYLAAIPEDKKDEAGINLKASVVPTKIVQTTRSNYIVYTPNPYIIDATGDITENSYITANMSQFIYQWDNKDSMIIRAGINGLVNYYQLASIVYFDSKDFQLSATPYGVFKNYYENVANGNLYGALPRLYSDYKNGDITLGSFTIPYYSYDNTTSKMKIEKVEVSQQSFIDAIKRVAKDRRPLSFNIKFGETSWTSNYRNFLFNLQQTIQQVSKGEIVVGLNSRDNQNPSNTQWYNNQSSPLGYINWSPDYNGVGTWVESSNILESTKVNNTTYEGVPGTNAHSSFHTYLTSMVYAINLMNYTWNADTNKYESTSSNLDQDNSDPYINDERIQKAFSDITLASFGIETNDKSFNNKTTPGQRYGTLAIELLNMLIENGVFNQSNLQKYVDNPALLQYPNSKPNDVLKLYLGGDVLKIGQSANFSKYLGIFTGQSTAKALYVNTVLDSDYNFIPRAEPGLNEKVISLVNPNYVARSGTQSVNYRDFGIKKLVNN